MKLHHSLVRPAFRKTRTPENPRKVQGKESLLEEDQVKKYLYRLDRYNFMGCIPQVLWELAESIPRTLSIVF